MLSTRVAAVLEEYGPEIWGHLVDRLFALGRELAKQVKQREGFELAMEPEANIVCFRLIPDQLNRDSLDQQNGFTERLRQRHLEAGEHYVVMTRFDGTAWLRCTLMNPLTEAEDLEAMLNSLESIASGLILQ